VAGQPQYAAAGAGSRKLLAEAGIDINSPANGVALPGTKAVPNPNGSTVHRGGGLHTNADYDRTEQMLRDVPPEEREAILRQRADELRKPKE